MNKKLKIFSGKILRFEQSSITITNAFHNGMKMKKFTSEVTIGQNEIENIEFVKVVDPSEVAMRNQSTPVDQVSENIQAKPSTIRSPSIIISKSPFSKPFKPVQNCTNLNEGNGQNHKTTKPIAILRRPAASTSNGYVSSPAPHSYKQENNQQGSKHKFKKRHNQKNFDLMQPDEFSEEVGRFVNFL